MRSMVRWLYDLRDTVLLILSPEIPGWLAARLPSFCFASPSEARRAEEARSRLGR